MPSFFFKYNGAHRDLPSSPTRRSSDLNCLCRSRRAISSRTTSGTEYRAYCTPRRSEEHTSELQSLAYLVCRLFFLNTTAPTEIYPLPLHDALPILTAYAGLAARYPAVPLQERNIEHIVRR